MHIFSFYATRYRHICTDMAVCICLYLPVCGLYLPVCGLGRGRFAFATAAALGRVYAGRLQYLFGLDQLDQTAQSQVATGATLLLRVEVSWHCWLPTVYEVVNAPSSNRATIMISNITIQSNQCLLLKRRIELGDLPSQSETGLLLVHGTINTANKKPSIDEQVSEQPANYTKIYFK